MILNHCSKQGTMVTYGGMSRKPITVPTVGHHYVSGRSSRKVHEISMVSETLFFKLGVQKTRNEIFFHLINIVIGQSELVQLV